MTYIPPLPPYPPPQQVTQSSNPTRPTLNRVFTPRESTLELLAGGGWQVPVVYGEDRVGGAVAKVAVVSYHLVMLVVWCVGEIDSIVDVLLSDGSALPAGITVTNYTGTTTQTVDSTLAAAFPGWANTLVATVAGQTVGLAYSVLDIPQGLITGVPRIIAQIKGRQVYDPRDVGQDENDPATWEWSDNPSLIKADFETNALFGRGRAIDWSSVEDAADANDDLISTEKRRTCNLSLLRQASVDDWSATLNGYAKCFTIDDGDQIKLLADRPRSASRSITDANVIHDNSGAPRLKLARRGLDDVPTVVRVIYTDKSTDQWRDASAYAKADGVDLGTVEWRESVVRLPGVDRYSQARREAIERYNAWHLTDLELREIIVDDTGLYDQAGDVVEITSARGLDAKGFTLASVEMVEPGRWRERGFEYQANVYSDSLESQPEVGDTSLPDPAAPPAITGLSLAEEVYQRKDGTYSSRIRATWDDPDFPFVLRYLIRTYDGPTLIFVGDSGADREYATPAIQEGITYTVDVAIISTTGATGESDIDQIIAQGNLLRPSDVSNFQGFEVGGEVRLSWDAAVDIGVLRYPVRYGVIDVTWDDATPIDVVDALRLVTRDIAEGTWDFLVKARDSVGLESENEARRTIPVTLDNSAYLVDSNEFDNPGLTNMEAFTLSRFDPKAYSVSDDGDTIATNLSASPLESNYPNVMATYHDSMTSTWLSETWDLGTSLSGDWRATMDGVTAVSESYSAWLELSSDASAWTQYPSLSAKTAARYARIRVEAETTATLRIAIPSATIRLNAVSRSESGSSTSLASGGKVITAEHAYTAVKSIIISPIGTSAIDWTNDDVRASVQQMNRLTYSRDLTQWTLSNVSASYNQTGLEGVANTASLVTDNETTNPATATRTITNFVGDTTNTARVFVKKDSDTSRFPKFRLSYTGGTATYLDVWLNTQTGASQGSVSGGGSGSQEVVDWDANWWLVLAQLQDVDSNTAATLIIFPAGGTTIGVASNSATGSIIVGNAEAYLYASREMVRTMDPVFCDDGVIEAGITKTEFDVYLFDAGGSQIANDFLWQLNAIG